MNTPEFIESLSKLLNDVALKDFIQTVGTFYIQKGVDLSGTEGLLGRPVIEIRSLFKDWITYRLGELDPLPVSQPQALSHAATLDEQFVPSQQPMAKERAVQGVVFDAPQTTAADLQEQAVGSALGDFSNGDLSGGYGQELRRQMHNRDRAQRAGLVISKEASHEDLGSAMQNTNSADQKAALLNNMIKGWLGQPRQLTTLSKSDVVRSETEAMLTMRRNGVPAALAKEMIEQPGQQQFVGVQPNAHANNVFPGVQQGLVQRPLRRQ